MTDGLLFSLIVAIIAIVYGFILVKFILKKSTGNDKMKEIAEAIHVGAKTYLNRQYRIVVVIAAILFFVLGFVFDWATATGFIIGVVLSVLIGYISVNVSVRANVRTCEAAKSGLVKAMSVAVQSGVVIGFLMVGLGLLGVTGLYIMTSSFRVLIGFGFGGSLISVFVRLGGGIFSKASDIGADLVGKLESGIPEDDSRNPAVIADSVGDNVGDCAGMAVDLFETYIVTTIATMLLGSLLFIAYPNAIIYPLVIGAISIITGIIGTWFISLGKSKNIMGALYKGLFITSILSVILLWPVTKRLMGDLTLYSAKDIYLSAIIGIVVTALLVIITEYYTSSKYKPVKDIAKASESGHGINIIVGLSASIKSAVLPVLVVILGIIFSYNLAGVYGIAIASTAMLSLVGIIVTIGSYGPITDNAGSIAEMAKLPKETRDVTDLLDAAGNTTRAVTNGYAIASAGFIALVLFTSYGQKFISYGLNLEFQLVDPKVMAGLFIGGMLSYWFSALAIEAVGKTADKVVKEVRYQFKEITGIIDGTAKPDYNRVIDVVTKSALKRMVALALIPVFVPVLVGFILGPIALGGVLIGSIVTGIFVAISMITGGGAWDNAKKYIEGGNFGGKNSPTYQAAVTGDIVGDPYKDTAGPAINPMIKIINIVALLLVALLI